ncbi:hypothetical protein CU024_1046 [Enterococcus faecium]|nr:hypothetical protein HMPREF1354_00220 [Enterococcus faecium 514]MBK4757556.1 hypothetical protein [Enterococcus faecium]MBK4782315.1 hypothetical protein [Enterococcus faecium]MBK4809082.1 hypothetical protein [Enterococcus faecium]MBK4850554.1 hypothetical protein [Enterococcus faecium]
MIATNCECVIGGPPFLISVILYQKHSLLALIFSKKTRFL